MSYRIGKSIKEKMKNVLYERKKYLRRQREPSAQIAFTMIGYKWKEKAGSDGLPLILARVKLYERGHKEGDAA